MWHAGLGNGLRLAKFLAATIVLVLAGGAVSLAGPVGFIGLMVPHVVRHLVGQDYRLVIPGSALCGSLLMLVADMAARLATTPFKAPVPVGVVTALLGVPFFLYLACRRPTGALAEAAHDSLPPMHPTTILLLLTLTLLVVAAVSLDLGSTRMSLVTSGGHIARSRRVDRQPRHLANAFAAAGAEHSDRGGRWPSRESFFRESPAMTWRVPTPWESTRALALA